MTKWTHLPGEKPKQSKPKRSKYGNRKVKYYGHNFDSIAEETRYKELKLLEKVDKIFGLTLQPVFLLSKSKRHPVFGTNKNGKHKLGGGVKYIADFSYTDFQGRRIVEDVKGVRTPAYKVKLAWFLELYGNDYDFREV